RGLLPEGGTPPPQVRDGACPGWGPDLTAPTPRLLPEEPLDLRVLTWWRVGVLYGAHGLGALLVTVSWRIRLFPSGRAHISTGLRMAWLLRRWRSPSPMLAGSGQG